MGEIKELLIKNGWIETNNIKPTFKKDDVFIRVEVWGVTDKGGCTKVIDLTK
jgi:hypothetical protein